MQLQEKQKEIKRISSKLYEISIKYDELKGKYDKEFIAEKQLTSSLDKTKSVKELIPFKGMKLIHFDLKGAPPKVDYFLKVMRMCKQYGATGFLIEYEDMFPWSGELKVLARKTAYSKEDLQHILNKASRLEMEIIPLVQTFGHLEFVLKHKEFVDLRAKKQVPTWICPLNNGSLPLILKMIDQIIDLHPSLKWIHLGGDEVWNIKACDSCNGQHTDLDLFYHHMLPIMKYTKKVVLSPIIWDDVMRWWDVTALKKMAEHVVPMVWGYVADLATYKSYPTDMWDRYLEAFPKIFFASSFKGALKPWSDFVPIHQHLTNHLSWLKIFKQYQNAGKSVEGIALTGWSRFDHYGPLCELLPSGIPSMALCLAILDHGGFDDNLHKKTSEMLGFSTPFQTNVEVFERYIPEVATFTGHKVYTLVGELEKALSFGWKEWAQDRLTGWSRRYNIRNGHVSYFQINDTLNGLEESLKRLGKLKLKTHAILSEYYDKETVHEWVVDKIDYYTEKILENLKNIGKIKEDNLT